MISFDRPAAQKLLGILQKKSARGGEFTLPFSADISPIAPRDSNPGFARYELEIGCGWGEYTRQTAAIQPKTFFLAIEKKLARVITSGREQKKLGITNVRYLILDVAWFFSGVFAAGQFDAVTINFPDPWPKLRHHKHRFVTPDLAEELARITAADSKFTFVSDDYRYSRECMEVFEASARWRNIAAPFSASHEIPGRSESFFEKLHRAEGATIYFLQYRKQELGPTP